MILEEYREKGFWISKGGLDNWKVRYAISAIQDAFVNQLRIRGICCQDLNTFELMKLLYDTDLNAYKATAAVLSKLLPVHRLLIDDSITGTMDRDKGIRALGMSFTTVVPTGPVVHVVSKELMIPGGYFGQEPHQDWPSMQGSLDSIVVWVPLCDIDKGLFPLQVIPGSHKGGMLPGGITEHQRGINPAEYSEEDFVSVELEKGDIVFMSSWTIHRTSLMGREGDVRIACSLRYENLNDPTFIERDYPSAYTRAVSRELITPNFPTKKQINGVFK
jgi:hypothetical protein